ncbi:unnamed protein product [Miscanthus lutarioriparius]|uniref:BSD domain-containing protein n=1 Tax=Miscanthus lutarioriparius TaxID=422564 RepID=A0A811SJP3_9POAL|nr:unnamed protein product [Miscanthus lutarioriparius]
MSWLARSLATSLNIPDDSGADDDRTPPPPLPLCAHPAAAAAAPHSPAAFGRSGGRQGGPHRALQNPNAPVLGRRQLPRATARGDLAVAVTLPSIVGGQSADARTPPEIAGIRNDFAEIGGRFRSGISRISGHKAVSGFSRMASSFFAPDDYAENEWDEERRRHIRYEMEEEVEGDEEWHQWEERVGLRAEDGDARHELEMERVRDEEDDELEELRTRHEDDGKLGEQRARHEEDGEPEELRVRHEEEEEVEEDWDVIGITEEVLAFATNIARHPETWLDFPLLHDDDESDGPFSYFDMSDAQQEHSLAIEHLAPRLAALRIELCPIHMNEECFWKIYFVLLHPRLNKHDAELLSTP